jgi:hypothetical protein
MHAHTHVVLTFGPYIVLTVFSSPYQPSFWTGVHNGVI